MDRINQPNKKTNIFRTLGAWIRADFHHFDSDLCTDWDEAHQCLSRKYDLLRR